MQQSVPIAFFACSWESAQAEVRRQYRCAWWIYDWPSTDPEWLFGSDYSPLARNYFNALAGGLNDTIGDAVVSCEARRYASPTPAEGLRLQVVSRLAGSVVDRDSSTTRAGQQATLSVPFRPGNDDDPDDDDCTSSGNPGGGPVPRELFMRPVDFGYVLHGPGGGNFRWDWRDRQTIAPDPYFELYGRTLKFSGGYGSQFLGSLHLVIDKLADLWVRFEPRPVPAALAGRVDPEQPLRYEVSRGGGYFNIVAVIEVLHLESGQIHSVSVHGPNLPPGHLPGWGRWPDGWDAMSSDAGGVIRHYNVDWFYWLNTVDPANTALPKTGTYRMRYILLAYGYRTEMRQVSSAATGLAGDTRMWSRPIFLSHMPSLITYTPGMTDGLIPPFEVSYTRSPILANGIGFDAVFDFKNLTTFRFVVKVTNQHDFALGVIVQASGWQAWVSLLPGETRYLAGAVSVSGMFNWNAYPLHPQSPYYGWSRGWSSSYIRMDPDGRCTIPFSLFLTAPTAPETTPANLPALRATQRWYWDLADFGPQFVPEWGAIKKYAEDGRYDYEYQLSAYNLSVGTLKALNRTTTQPAYQALINPASYFVTGYGTSAYDWGSPWHKRPWPTYSGWGNLSAPIMCRGEKRRYDGNLRQYVWEYFDQLSVSLSRALLQQVAAALGVSDYVVMDGDDIRWFQIGAGGEWHNLLWIDRFYTRGGALVDAGAMRNAFQAVIDGNASSWPDYRNLVVHPSVRFGSFLDNGGFEVGDYLLGPNGDMVEVASLADLNGLSTRFLYRIRPEFQ